MFNFSKMFAQVGSSKGSELGVKVSSKVLGQIETGGLKQAQITVTGIPAERRGLVSFKVGEKVYTLNKGDTHAFWAVHNKAQIEEYSELFNTLAANPDTVTSIELVK